MRLASTAWPQLPPGPLLVVPVGSTEQHGPHLPAGTDTLVAEAVARGVVDALPDACLAPAVAYGASGEHEHFPGTVSIGHEALELLLVELGRSACRWAGRLLLVNGHGGNLPTVPRAVGRLRSEGRDVAWTPCALPGADAHAGRFETSLLLALAPAAVRLDDAVAGPTAALAELLPALRRGGVRAISPHGVLGDPAGASAAEGAQLLGALVARAVTCAAAWEVGPDGRLSADHAADHAAGGPVADHAAGGPVADHAAGGAGLGS